MDPLSEVLDLMNAHSASWSNNSASVSQIVSAISLLNMQHGTSQFPNPVWFICRCAKQAVGAIVRGKWYEFCTSCQRTCRVASLRRLI